MGAAISLGSGPLEGVRVVELGRFVAAPFASRWLADLGADVVKVETLAGDPFRSFTYGRAPGLSSSFVALNRNKRSLSLDLRRDEALMALKAKIGGSDVFLANFRPEALVGMGLDADTLLVENPHLIYCNITGFGSGGPYSGRPGYDTMGQALSGMLSQYLDDTDPQIRGPNLADSITGMAAALAVVSALYLRQHSDRGQEVSVNLLTSTLALLTTEAQRFLDTGFATQPTTRPAASVAFAFRCKDDHVLTVHLSSPTKFWLAFIEVLGRPELASDPRFSTHMARQEHHAALHAELVDLFRRETVRTWEERLVTVGVPCAVVNDMETVFADPQLDWLDVRSDFDGCAEGAQTVRAPLGFDSHPVLPLRMAPRLGQHSVEVLAELGVSRSEIDRGLQEGFYFQDPES